MAETFDKQAIMQPSAWEVMCPSCEKWHEVEKVEEDYAGRIAPAGESTFILCECGCNIEIKPPAPCACVFEKDACLEPCCYHQDLEKNHKDVLAHNELLRHKLAHMGNEKMGYPPALALHDYEANKKFPWMCNICGYAEHEPLKHKAAAQRESERLK